MTKKKLKKMKEFHWQKNLVQFSKEHQQKKQLEQKIFFEKIANKIINPNCVIENSPTNEMEDVRNNSVRLEDTKKTNKKRLLLNIILVIILVKILMINKLKINSISLINYN